MKYFILLAVVVVAVQALDDAQKAKLKGYYDKCVKETNVDESLIKKLRAAEFVNDDKLKAYVHCMFKSLGFINEQGEIQFEVIKAKIPADVDKTETEKVVTKCKNEKGSSAVETAFAVYKCYRSSVQKPIIPV